MLWKSPQPEPSEWKWEFALWRRIGNYRLCFEWFQYRYTEKDNLNYMIEYRTKDGQHLHIHSGQFQPEW